MSWPRGTHSFPVGWEPRAHRGVRLARQIAHVTSTMGVAFLYAVLKLLLTAILRRVGPLEFTSAAAARQHRAVLFILSSINALVVIRHHLWIEAPKLWHRGKLFPDYLTSVRAMDAEKQLKQSQEQSDGQMTSGILHDDLAAIVEEKRQHQLHAERLLLAVNGYLVHDLIALGPSGWRAYPVDLFHHLVGIGLTSNCLLRLEHTYPFCSMMLIAESSTLFLNAMWFCREFPNTIAGLVAKLRLQGLLRSATPGDAVKVLGETLIPRLFLLLFTYTRIFSMTVGLIKLNRTKIPEESRTAKENEWTKNG